MASEHHDTSPEANSLFLLSHSLLSLPSFFSLNTVWCASAQETEVGDGGWDSFTDAYQ